MTRDNHTGIVKFYGSKSFGNILVKTSKSCQDPAEARYPLVFAGAWQLGEFCSTLFFAAHVHPPAPHQSHDLALVSKLVCDAGQEKSGILLRWYAHAGLLQFGQVCCAGRALLPYSVLVSMAELLSCVVSV